MKTAARLEGMRPSPVRMLSEGAPPDAISLGLGEPTWDMPKAAVAALKEISGPCNYGHNQGLPELRITLGRYYGTDVDHVLVTSGSQAALFALLHAWVGPGDKILSPDPGFVAYAGIAQLTGSEVVRYRLDANNAFRLQSSALLPYLDDSAVKAVILNHPGNPTGGGMTIDELRIVAVACEKRGILLISDEVYRDLYFKERTPSLRDVTQYGIVTSSVSKAWSSPGLRIGWAIGDPLWLQPARVMHSFMVTGASVPAQKAAVAMIESSEEIHTQARRELYARWDAMRESLKQYLGIDAVAPDGAFYYWTRIPASATADPLQFCLRLRDEAKVIVVPGFLFGEAGSQYIRLSFAAFPDQVRQGIQRLSRLWQ